MLIGLPIAIMYFLPRKITAEGTEVRRDAPSSAYSAVKFPVWLQYVPGSSCIVKSLDSGFRYLSSYVVFFVSAKYVHLM